VALVVAVGVLIVVRLARTPAARRPPQSEPGVEAVVILDVRQGTPDSPAVRRLVHEAAAHALASSALIQVVEVRDASGRVLGKVSRQAPPPPAAAVPEDLVEPHAHLTRSGPLATARAHERRDEGSASASPAVDLPLPAARHRPLVEGFDLPPSVAVQDPDDPVELVRAILEGAGLPCVVQGRLIRTGDRALVVLPRPTGGVTDRDTLSRAFREIARSGAGEGFVVTVGLLDPADLRRREILAPNVHHVAHDGVQRMADAVAVGADPFAFALGKFVLPGQVDQPA
jgi:hypothetical protein